MQVTYIYIKVISANGNNKIRKDIISEKIKKKKKKERKGKKERGKKKGKGKKKPPSLSTIHSHALQVALYWLCFL